MHFFMTKLDGEAAPPAVFTESKDLQQRGGTNELLPTNAANPYGLAVLDQDTEDAAVYKLIDGQVEFVRIRSLQQLEAQGVKGTGLVSRLISRLNRWVSRMVGGPISGWYLYYRLIRRGRKATLAVDLHNATSCIDDDQFQRNLDLLAEAFPTFVGAVANSKARVERAPLMGRIAGDQAERRWTLMLDFDMPEVKVSELNFKLNPHENWITSKLAVAVLLSQPSTVEIIKRLDKVAAAIYREASHYHGIFANKQYKALKIGLKRDIARLRSDPIRLTYFLVRPLLGIIGMISDDTPDLSDSDGSDLVLPVELHGSIADGTELIKAADALSPPDHPFAGVPEFDQTAIHPSSKVVPHDNDIGHVTDSLTPTLVDPPSPGTHPIRFSGGCDCGYNPNNCGAGHFCRWQY